MKVAHIAIVTPNRSGLYETTRELVSAERDVGIDARIVDPQPHETLSLPVGSLDRGVPIASMEWATKADIICSHSGHDGTAVAQTDQPIIIVAHGRPSSTWAMECDGGPKGFTYHVTRPRQSRYKACVTFWAEYEPFFRPLWAPKPVHVIPAPVDLEYWTPGTSSYDFGGRGSRVNIVMTDPWTRKDYDPVPMVAAFNLFRSLEPEAKLHCYAVNNTPGLQALKTMLGDHLGIIQGWASDLRSVYRAADLLITTHTIATRSVREALACGVPVVSGADVGPWETETFALTMMKAISDPAIIAPRTLAEARFHPHRSSEEMLRLLEHIV